MSIPLDRDYLKKFGKHFRDIRKSKGLSQGNLAIKAETHRSLISSIEKGECNTSINTLNALARALGIKPIEFHSFED